MDHYSGYSEKHYCSLGMVTRRNISNGRAFDLESMTSRVSITTSFAASSARNPWHDSAAASLDSASRMLSDAIISLPSIFESCEYQGERVIFHNSIKETQEENKLQPSLTLHVESAQCTCQSISTMNFDRHKPPGQQRRGPT
jgi:hypothetical protein